MTNSLSTDGGGGDSCNCCGFSRRMSAFVSSVGGYDVEYIGADMSLPNIPDIEQEARLLMPWNAITSRSNTARSCESCAGL